MSRCAVWLLVVVSVATACSIPLQDERQPTSTPSMPASTAATIDPRVALRRPIAPFLSNTCRPSSGRDASQIPGAVGFKPGGYVAFGNGPIYPAFWPRGDREFAVLSFAELAQPTWLGTQASLRFTKVLWIADPGFRGDVLVRGVPGSPPAAFGHYGKSPFPPEMFFTVADEAGGYFYFSSPGCYAFQIDGAHFSTEFIVEVR
jgi:hypothetical protein